MPDPTGEALIVTGGNYGVDTVTGFRKDGTIFEDYGVLTQGRYAHACGSYLSSDDIPIPVSLTYQYINPLKECIYIF